MDNNGPSLKIAFNWQPQPGNPQEPYVQTAYCRLLHVPNCLYDILGII